MLKINDKILCLATGKVGEVVNLKPYLAKWEDDDNLFEVSLELTSIITHLDDETIDMIRLPYTMLFNMAEDWEMQRDLYEKEIAILKSQIACEEDI
jgi:hypothetical protein